jgi:hypothetical protein
MNDDRLAQVEKLLAEMLELTNVAVIDSLIYGNGFLTVDKEGKLKYIPPEQVVEWAEWYKKIAADPDMAD